MNDLDIYPAEYRGPSQDKLDAAHAVLAEQKEALIDVEKRSAIRCDVCDEINVCGRWVKIEVWETTFGPYERDKNHVHDLLKCPDCGHEHKCLWATPALDRLMKHMKKERLDD